MRYGNYTGDEIDLRRTYYTVENIQVSAGGQRFFNATEALQQGNLTNNNTTGNKIVPWLYTLNFKITGPSYTPAKAGSISDAVTIIIGQMKTAKIKDTPYGTQASTLSQLAPLACRNPTEKKQFVELARRVYKVNESDSNVAFDKIEVIDMDKIEFQQEPNQVGFIGAADNIAMNGIWWTALGTGLTSVGITETSITARSELIFTC